MLLPADESQRQAYSVEEAAALAGITPWTARTLIAKGEWPVTHAGARVLVSRDTLLAWLPTR